MLRSICLLFIFATPQWASHESLAKENLFYLTEHIFKEVGGFKTFYLITGLKGEVETDKDLDLIFKAAGVDKGKALIAFKCYGTATELINAGIKPVIAIRITKEAKEDEENIDSAVSVLAYALKKEGVFVDSTQIVEALRQAELLLHLELNPKVAFEENGIDIDLIDLVQREVERIKAERKKAGQWSRNLKEEDLLPRGRK